MMAVKANGPADVDRSTEHRGSSIATPGLTALDEEREASLADEGGASAAVIESQDRPGPSLQSGTRRRGGRFWLVASALTASALGVLAIRKRR